MEGLFNLNNMEYSKAKRESLKVPWKMSFCNSGPTCWCRIIEPETLIIVEVLGSTESFIVIGDGCIDKETATHLVELHNNSLK